MWPEAFALGHKPEDKSQRALGLNLWLVVPDPEYAGQLHSRPAKMQLDILFVHVVGFLHCIF